MGGFGFFGLVFWFGLFVWSYWFMGLNGMSGWVIV